LDGGGDDAGHRPFWPRDPDLNMLIELSVKHLAIIDDVTLRLGPGLNVLTGETGAGKSILVGAMSLGLGARASAQDIRRGEQSAEVEAVFDFSGEKGPAKDLKEAGFLEDGLLIARRIVSASGPNRVYLGGRSAPLSRLADFGERLVSIYGQNDSRGLLQPENHLLILDETGGLQGERRRLTKRFEEVLALRGELADLERKQSEAAARSDYLEFLLREIKAAKISPGEDEVLKERRRVLVSAGKLAAVAGEILSECYEAEGSIAERSGMLARRAADAAGIDPALEEIARAVEGLAIASEEAGRSVRVYLEGLEQDPAELDRIESRLEMIRALSKKYGGSLEAVLKTAKDASRELEEISTLSFGIREIEKRLGGAERKLKDLAEGLSAKRQKAGKNLSGRVVRELADLGMEHAAFEPAFPSPPEGAGMDVDGLRLESTGGERCEFLLSANPGVEPRPLAQIASGGELSRVMLAIKNALASAFYVPTLVFDEIDAGIGGAQAEIVGRKLAQVARRHQVLCITHLPQIAGLADRHILVEKEVIAGRTRTTVRTVSGKDREKELARMVGGLTITEATRATAREMIKNGGGS